MPAGRKLGCSLFCVLLFCYSSVHQKSGANQESRLDLLHSLVIHHTFKIDAYESNTIDKSFKDGHFYCDKAPGIVFLSLPAFFASAIVSKSFHIDPDSDAGWLLTDWITTAGSVGLITAVGGVALFALLAKFLNDQIAFLAILAAFLGSSPFPYATMLFSHAAVLGLISIALWAISDDFFFRTLLTATPVNSKPPVPRPFLKRHVLAGLCCGLAIASEYTSAIAAAGVLVLALMVAFKRGLTLALSALPLLLLIPITNWVCFGSPLAFGYHSEATPEFQSMNRGFFGISFPPAPSAAYLILLSPERGLFFWTPFFFMAFAGLKPSFKIAPKICLVAGIVAGLQVMAISGYYMPGGGWALGPRHLAPMLPFLTILAAYGLAKIPTLGITLGFWSILLTGSATCIDALLPDWVDNPLDYYVSRFLNGDSARTLLACDGMPAVVAVSLILGVMVAFYIWGVFYLRHGTPKIFPSTVS